MERLYTTFHQLVRRTDLAFVRYKYADIRWGNRMLGLIGPRGVGKTTLLLQHAKQALPAEGTLYASADNLYFADHTLVDLADALSKQGGRYLLLDEIHKYANWSRELKQIYDSYPDLHVYFTGSSVLDIYRGMADLSRRAPIYEMQGLSFREYLRLFHGITAPVLTLDDILHHRAEIPGTLHPLPLFNDYLRRGYYPFGRDEDFDIKLEQVITQTLESDIPLYAGMNVATGRKLKQLLMVVAAGAPFKPSMATLAETTGISRNNVAPYLLYMERAGMIGQLRTATGGIRGLGKVEKIYLDSPNLMAVLCHDGGNRGNVRETFFYNQTRVRYDVTSSPTADFLIDGCTFEVGGRGKGQRQLQGTPQGYVVKDDIETGYANVLPLWAFGLTY